MLNKDFVIGMSQKRLDSETLFTYDRSSNEYIEYITSLKKAIIAYKDSEPNALIFYGFAYENPVYTKPIDDSVILRIQHGNVYHQFHFHRADIDTFEFWRNRILSVTRAIDRRIVYSADYARVHMLTRSTAQETCDFLAKYGA